MEPTAPHVNVAVPSNHKHTFKQSGQLEGFITIHGYSKSQVCGVLSAKIRRKVEITSALDNLSPLSSSLVSALCSGRLGPDLSTP